MGFDNQEGLLWGQRTQKIMILGKQLEKDEKIPIKNIDKPISTNANYLQVNDAGLMV